MKTLLHPTMRATLGLLLLLCMWQLAVEGAGWAALSGGVNAGVLLLAALVVLFGALLRRVRSDDRVVRLEADLCRERGARTRADEALAEADLLLARISGRSGRSGRSGVCGQQDPVGQLGLVQAELMQMQHGAADPAIAARIEMLRTRLDLVAKVVRQTARTA
jgi:hypothetical protein